MYNEQVFNGWVGTTAETKGNRDLRAELVAPAGGHARAAAAVAVPSLRSIAKACGVAPSAVYWHFPSEADLRSAVLDAEYTSLIDAVETALDSAGAARRRAGGRG
ncbi:TetR/AcrR family transcriptional regulator [Streptomyces sp. T1317-0309]|nr:TetR/AcrR family transcriptional regulator [Streptomyces sp. T1317-0309]